MSTPLSVCLPFRCGPDSAHSPQLAGRGSALLVKDLTGLTQPGLNMANPILWSANTPCPLKSLKEHPETAHFLPTLALCSSWCHTHFMDERTESQRYCYWPQQTFRVSR